MIKKEKIYQKYIIVTDYITHILLIIYPLMFILQLVYVLHAIYARNEESKNFLFYKQYIYQHDIYFK